MLYRLCAFAVGVILITSPPVLAQAPADPPAAAPDYSQEAFVIERTRTVYRFEHDGTGQRENHVRVRIQSDAGVQYWGQLVLGYNAATEHFDIRFVRVLKADGSVVTAPADAVQELTSPVQREAPVYTDFRQKHVTVPSLRPGEILEFSIAADVHTPLAAGHFWIEHDFEAFAVVLDEQLEIDIPRDRAVLLRTADGADPALTEDGDRRVYRWTSAQTTPTSELAQRLADDEEDTAPAAVRLTTFQRWEEVGAWYAALERPARAVTPEIRARALDLTHGMSSDLDKLEALYDYVAQGFRYVSISLGLGRYQPRPAADVLRDQYGDCKDKHTLLATLLESIGLRASTVLIHSTATLDPDFPSPSQFDHAITRAEVDGEAVWLDVTTEIAPFRLLLANLRDRAALVVHDGSGRLEDTPGDPPHGNIVRQEIDGTVGEHGTLTARVRYEARGDLELIFRTIFYRTPSLRWREVVQGMNAAHGLGEDVGEVTVSDPRATREPFVIEYQVTRPRFVEATRRTASLRLPMSDLTLPPHEGTRPLELGTMELSYRLQLELGAGYEARAPLPVSIARDYGTYEASYQLEGRRFAAERTLRVGARTIAPERAADYTAFRRVVEADDAQTLALDLPASTAVPAEAPLGTDDLLRSGMDAFRSGEYSRAVALLSRVVEEAPQHEAAWMALGLTHAAAGDAGGAIAAFTRQIENNPFHELAYSAIGAVYASQRRYAEAEAAFLRQLEVNPLDRQVPERLGGLYLQMQRYADAAAQLERAIAMTPDNAALHVERGRAYLLLGQDEDALAAFDRAVALSSTAMIWNNLAYYLAEAGAHLERAQQYAESAVASVAAESRSFTIDRITARELGVVSSLAAYWDTLGWIFFKQGDLERAERLIEAAWRLAQTGVLGDHLAQIYEQQGRPDVAIRTYAAALAAGRPDPVVRERLLALAGSAGRVDALVAEHAADLVQQRTVAVAPGEATGSAEFHLLIGPDGIEGVSFIRGDEALREMSGAIRAADFGGLLPVAPAKVLRRGALACSSATGTPSCSLILLRSSEARAAEPAVGILDPVRPR